MDDLRHYGTPRHSGRYPYGSGEDGYQRISDFLGTVHKLKKQGVSEVDIAKGMGMKTSDLRKRVTIAKEAKRAADSAEAQRLFDKGMSYVAIGERMGRNESSVRALLDPVLRERALVTTVTADKLRSAVEKDKWIDVGTGVESRMGISRTKLNTAVFMLEEEGYPVHQVENKQVGTGKYTIMKVLALPGTTEKDAFAHRFDIKLVDGYSEDGGKTYKVIEPIQSIDSKRIHVRYGDDEPSGKDKDGVIELRRGVEDLAMAKNYAQVRIGVDGTHFMKGMAMYSDHIPEGKDVVYNTNKTHAEKDKVFKPMKADKENAEEIDPDNPFGSIIRQQHYIGSDGKEHLSALNMVGSPTKEGSGEEGSWGKWRKTISSQVLSKQSPALAKRQLGLALDLKKEEYDEIMSLTNPAVKKRLLESFADDADSAAVHLKAAALPRQSSHVLLPFDSIKENEIYAPNFKDGEHVVLIRHPHGGTFEIPQLVVNNKNKEAKSIIGQAEDAVGIHHKVAERLSGADFDGDTVLVIPNNEGYIRTTSPIKGIVDFEPHTMYKKYPGMKVMEEGAKQLKMGEISNLITDMTIKGATEDKIARAVRHSMVVIDAVKHELNYKQSYIDNNILDLKKEYQDNGDGKFGASTIISKAKSKVWVNERKAGKMVPVIDPRTGKQKIDPETGKPKTKRIFVDPTTGEKLYEETGKTTKERKKRINPETGEKEYVDTGKVVKKQTVVTKMELAEDANTLVSKPGTVMESIYADHANAMKTIARKARLAALEIEPMTYSQSARDVYAKEVTSLKHKLNESLKNKPLEREAQLLANKTIATKRKNNPNMPKDELKKLKGLALIDARARVHAEKHPVNISDREWEAIQAGAVSHHYLSQIILNTDLDSLKQRAMPRPPTVMSPARLSRARDMYDKGYTTSEISELLGVSVDTLHRSFA